MKELLFAAFALSVTAPASAKDHDYICQGKDRHGRSLTVVFDEYKGKNDAAEANVTVQLQGKPAKVYKGLTVYADSEGAFDYGVTGSDFMFELILPPNMLDGNTVAGGYYTGPEYTLKTRVILACTPQ